MSFFSTEEQLALISNVESTMSALFDLDQYVAGAQDDWNQETPGTPVTLTDQPCSYSLEEVQPLGLVEGAVAAGQPHLLVKRIQPVKAGDQVRNLRDGAGVVVLAGPVEVQDVVLVDLVGQVTYKRVILQFQTVHPVGA